MGATDTGHDSGHPDTWPPMAMIGHLAAPDGHGCLMPMSAVMRRQQVLARVAAEVPPTVCGARVGDRAVRGQDVSERHRVVDHHLGPVLREWGRQRPPRSSSSGRLRRPADYSAGRSAGWRRRTTASRKLLAHDRQVHREMVPADLPRLKTEMAAIDARDEMLELLRSLHTRQRRSRTPAGREAAGQPGTSPRAALRDLRRMYCERAPAVHCVVN